MGLDIRIPIGLMFAILGVLLWAGLFLRDSRLRALLPLRRLPEVG